VINIGKILDNKAVKITAIILLPSILIGSYYGVKWVIKKHKELKLKKQDNK
jgi:uncharacterized membrane protein YfcA